MKNIAPLLISCFLVVGATACSDPAKTSADAPNTTSTTTQVTDKGATEAAKEDAQSRIRRNQLNADIRAREQRNNWGGGDTKRDPDDLASQVRSKLEANIPNGHLAVEANEDGTVYVTGTVQNQDQFKKIAPLAKEIKGVSFVEMKVTVANQKS